MRALLWPLQQHHRRLTTLHRLFIISQGRESAISKTAALKTNGSKADEESIQNKKRGKDKDRAGTRDSSTSHEEFRRTSGQPAPTGLTHMMALPGGQRHEYEGVF